MQLLRAIYYRLTKSRGAKITAGVLLLLILGAAAYSFGPGKLNTAGGRTKFLRDNPAIRRLLPVYWQIRKVSDIWYLPYYFREDNIPDYELRIAPNDLQKMNRSLPAAFSDVIYTNKVFVPARFVAEGKIYDVEVRYRGDNAQHWNAPKKSYLVRFKKNDLFQGMREVSFIIIDDRKFALEEFNNWRAKKLGLRVPQSGFASLEVNDFGRALYFATGSWSPEMLVKWGAGEGSYLYGEGDLETTGGDIWKDISLWQEVAIDDRYPFRHQSRLPELLKLLNEAPDAEFNAKIFTLIDRDNFYSWQIHQELVNSTHQNLGNIRLLYDVGAGKFFFIPWDAGSEDLSKDHFGSYGPLQKRIFRSPEFLAEKNRRLRDYLSDEKNLQEDLRFYDEAYESLRVSLYQDRLKIYSNRFADRVYREQREIIEGQFYRLRDKLKSSKI